MSAELVPSVKSESPLAVLAALGSGSVRLRKAMTAWAVGAAAFQTGKTARQWWLTRYQYAVSIDSDEDIYDDVALALLEMIPERNKRALLATAMRGRNRLRRGQALEISPSGYVVSGFQEDTRIATFYDGTTAQTFELDGHRIHAAVMERPISFKDYSGGGNYASERIRFTAHGEEGKRAVLRWLESIVRARDVVEAPRLFMLRYGSWYRRTDREARSLESVVLRAGQMERITEDVRTFLSWEEDYRRLGWPWHRGYLLYGPPGTGKTSVAHAVSAHFGLDLYYVPLKDVEKDATLLHAVSEIPPNSVLLLEDIDVYHAATQRNDAQAGASLSGLLNALDGVATPHGLITVLTTNDREAIDEAVIRSGRADLQEEIGYVDDEQLHRLVRTVVDDEFTLPAVGDGMTVRITPADVLGPFKQHIHEPKLGLPLLREMLEERRRTACPTS